MMLSNEDKLKEFVELDSSLKKLDKLTSMKLSEIKGQRDKFLKEAFYEAIPKVGLWQYKVHNHLTMDLQWKGSQFGYFPRVPFWGQLKNKVYGKVNLSPDDDLMKVTIHANSEKELWQIINDYNLKISEVSLAKALKYFEDRVTGEWKIMNKFKERIGR